MKITNDLNFSLLEFDSETIMQLNESIKKDSEFLCSHNLMDYSLLLTIETSWQDLTMSMKQSINNTSRSTVIE